MGQPQSVPHSETDSVNLGDILEGAAYINLDSRRDRFDSINLTMQQLGIMYPIRIVATTADPPFQGCTQSHIRALQLLQLTFRDGWVAVFEDDFVLHSNLQHMQKRICRFLSTFQEAQVLMLAVNPYRTKSTELEGVSKVDWGLTASAYMIRASYIPTLIKNMRKAAELQTPLDVQWRELQKNGCWYALDPMLGQQAAGYSDIERRVVNYGS